MSRELVYRAQCDVCKDEAIVEIDSPEGDTKLNLDVPFTIGDRTVLLDLCDSDLLEAQDRFEDYFSVGRTPAAEKPKRKSPVPRVRTADDEAKTYPCTQPGCDFIGKRPQGLGAHRRNAHGMKGRTAK